MSLSQYPLGTIPIDEKLLQFLHAIDSARIAWKTAVNQINAACDDVWLARMWEVEKLEGQYRTCQDQLFFYLKQLVHL
jgi:hypothetical protein